MQLLKLRRLTPLFIAACLLAGVGSAETTAARADKGAKQAPAKKTKKRNPESASSVSGAVAVECRMEVAPSGLAGISEASGLAIGLRTPGILWSHEDSYAGEPVLYAFDGKGAVKGKVRIEGVTVTDWEDVAVGACGRSSCVYIADIGDNQATRKSIAIHRVPEPLPGDATTRPIETFHATFPDGPHDAEAMFVSAKGDVYVVTKGDRGPIALYRFAPAAKGADSTPLQKVAVLHGEGVSKDQWITGASASPDGRWVALRTHGAVFFYDADRLLKGDTKSPLKFDATGLRENQGEGVALGADGSLFLSGESGRKGGPGTLASGTCRLPTERAQAAQR